MKNLLWFLPLFIFACSHEAPRPNPRPELSFPQEVGTPPPEAPVTSEPLENLKSYGEIPVIDRNYRAPPTELSDPNLATPFMEPDSNTQDLLPYDDAAFEVVCADRRFRAWEIKDDEEDFKALNSQSMRWEILVRSECTYKKITPNY